jgi:hypothetical protein
MNYQYIRHCGQNLTENLFGTEHNADDQGSDVHRSDAGDARNQESPDFALVGQRRICVGKEEA